MVKSVFFLFQNVNEFSLIKFNKISYPFFFYINLNGMQV